MELTYDEFCEIVAGVHDEYLRVQYHGSLRNFADKKFERLFFLYNEQLYVVDADSRFDKVDYFGGMWATKCRITDFSQDWSNSPKTDGDVLPISDRVEAMNG